MTALDFTEPVFATFAIAASLMILKVVAMSWLTVVRMLSVNGGFRSPEDTRKTPLNKNPAPSQLEINDRVDRIRRIQQNDLENVPFFLAAGFLYTLTAPPLLLAQILLYGFVVLRLLHFWAYLTAQTHDLRSMIWTPSSLIIVFMAVRVLLYPFAI